MPQAGSAYQAAIRRVAEVAERAVAEFDFGPHRLELISHYTNTTFALTTERERYVVRVHRAKGRTRDQVAGEVAWLDALAQDTDIGIPGVQRTPSGDAVVSMSTPDGERMYPVTILERVSGKQVKTKDKRHFQELGSLTAKLHRHAQAWRPAKEREVDRPTYNANSVLNRGVDGPVATTLGPRANAVNDALSVLREQLEEAEARLGVAPASFGLIHGDLSFGNVLFGEQGPVPIDFDDCGFGYFLHDFAVPLAGAYQQPGFEERYDAFLGGYRQVLALAPDLLLHLPVFLGLRSAQLILDYSGPSPWPEGILDQLRTRLQPALADSLRPSKWQR